MTPETEQTATGEQYLVTGVAPVTWKQRLQLLANAPLRAHKPQNPPEYRAVRRRRPQPT